MRVERIHVSTSTIGEPLRSADARQELREEIAPRLRQINEKIREGWRVAGLDYIIFTEGEGLDLIVMLERPD